MNPITRALMTGGDIDAALDKADLLHAVQTKIFCDKSGRVLDVRDAVLVKVQKGRAVGRMVLVGEVYDALAESIAQTAEQTGATLTVIDGRAK
ncbi:hypothetical protein [Actinoplanes sp. NPDC026670]|uniref:hypothetical protein n=1 Tax=Actinoplanes sp. NPDC026670 TaxID=3154700 RepID=UPI0033E41D8A